MFKINIIISRIVFVLAKVFYYFDIWDVKTKYFIVMNNHSKINSKPLDEVLFRMLILGEDRKYFYHIGIDIWGIIRAFCMNIMGECQGGSTITQQYIRALTNYNEMNYKRKVVEIFLALLINDKLEKDIIAQNYLSIAYFGHNMIGIDDASKKLNVSIPRVLFSAELIARLKYPQNQFYNFENSKKTIIRADYLFSLFTGKLALSNNFYWKNRSFFPKERKKL